MVDKSTKEGDGQQDEELNVVEVDNLEDAAKEAEEAAKAAGEAKAAEAAAKAAGDDDDDDRLADSADDTDDEVVNQRNRERRRNRREMQRRARERKDAQLDELLQQNAQLAQRLAQIEAGHLTSTAATIESQYSAAQADIARAEAILAAAVEAGNGADTTEALRVRDAARDRANALREQYGRIQQTFESHQQQTQVVRPSESEDRKTQLGRAWIQANPWFKPDGSDEDSAITKVIDTQVLRDGYDPNTLEYWQELTRRVNERFEGPAKQQAAAPRKQAPPTGTNREHVPATTRNEVYVTPARKQAMIDAGVWDDPVARARYLKSYRDYDNSAR